MSCSEPSGPAEQAPAFPVWPALALGLAAFLANFDVTAVVAALPAIARDLGLDVAGYAWVMDAYSLSFTCWLLIAGALADRYGRRRTLLLGNLAFAAASLGCGLAWNEASLAAARAAQGLGAAFVVTGGFALIATTYPSPTSRARAFSWLGVTSGIAMAMGPTLGGLTAAWLGWRWIFLLNLPICGLICWSVPRLIAEARDPAPRFVDLSGMAMLTAALLLLVVSLLHVASSPAASSAGFGLASLLLATFIKQQSRRVQPIFDPGVFANRTVAGIALLLTAVSVGYWALLVYLPPFLAHVRGLETDLVGTTLLAATLPMLLLPPLGGRSVSALGWRRHFVVALGFMAIGNAIFAVTLVSNVPSVWSVIPAMALIGSGAALAHPQLSGAVVALAGSEQAGMASAATVVVRQASFAIGIAALGATLVTTDRADAYSPLFLTATIVCLAGILAAAVLLPPRQRGEPSEVTPAGPSPFEGR